jgi:hypothetical protein
MTYDEMIAMIQAQKEGKRLEFRKVNSTEQWRDNLSLEGFDFFCYEYRIKKRTLHQYNYMTDNGEVYRSGRFFESKEAAQKAVLCKILGPALETRLEI